MNGNDINAQYSTGLARQNIERALIAAGKNSGRLQPTDLGMLEDFHTMGRIATSQLAELAMITSQDHVLDAGSGIGGTAEKAANLTQDLSSGRLRAMQGIAYRVG